MDRIASVVRIHRPMVGLEEDTAMAPDTDQAMVLMVLMEAGMEATVWVE